MKSLPFLHVRSDFRSSPAGRQRQIVFSAAQAGSKAVFFEGLVSILSFRMSPPRLAAARGDLHPIRGAGAAMPQKSTRPSPLPTHRDSCDKSPQLSNGHVSGPRLCDTLSTLTRRSCSFSMKPMQASRLLKFAAPLTSRCERSIVGANAMEA
jgi:hypothetical protein